MDDKAFLHQFESAALPFTDWHHKQHIKVAYLYLRSYPFDEALERMRESLERLNIAHKVPDEPGRGYHETMTQAWLRLVHVTLCEYGPAENTEAFYEKNPQLSQPKALRLFYSQNILMSARAKAEFVEPDLAPLPKIKKK